MTTSHRYALGLTLALLIATMPAAATADPTAPEQGRFQTRFETTSELAAWSELADRLGWGDAKEGPYDLSQETFEVFVPRSAGQRPMGLVVWISPSDSGEPAEAYLPALQRRRLIWIGANASGNEQRMDRRLRLALDAAAHMRERYDIDPQRVYIAGWSGGGRMASILALHYPETFTGGYFIQGANYFRRIDTPAGVAPGKPPPTFHPPTPQRLDQAKSRSRIVLLTTEQDHNRGQILATAEHGFRHDGFEHVTVVDVPGIGHELPMVRWFERGLEGLEGKAGAVERVSLNPAPYTALDAPIAKGHDTQSRYPIRQECSTLRFHWA